MLCPFMVELTRNCSKIICLSPFKACNKRDSSGVERNPTDEITVCLKEFQFHEDPFEVL